MMVQNVHYVKMVFTQIVLKLARNAINHVKHVLKEHPLIAHHVKIIHFTMIQVKKLARHAPHHVLLAILL